MATAYPTANRQPIQLARGTYCSLNSNRNLLKDGELCYAEDLNALFVCDVRNGVHTLRAVQSTVRPEPPPVLRLHGLLDVTAPGTAPAAPRNGDIVLAVKAGTVDAAWTALAGATVAAGDQIVYDAALPGWRNLGPSVTVPDWLFDLSKLPRLP